VGMGTIRVPRDEEIPIYKTVNDTRLARKMFPDFTDNKDGTLRIITGYGPEPVIVGSEKGFTYIGTPKK
jgi:hypothetical protein